MSRRRFLHLERERAENAKPSAPSAPGADDAPPASGRRGVSERFGGVTPAGAERGEAPSEEARPASTGLRPERFEAAPPPQLGVQSRDPESLPFSRCVHCQTDNSRFVDRCSRCGNTFDSPEQRAYDAELAERLRAARLEEEEALRAMREGRAGTAGSPDVEAQRTLANRSYGEALATRERERVEWELSTEGGSDSLGLRLVRSIPSAPVRMGVLGGVVLLAALPWLFRADTPKSFFFRILSVGVVLLFTPPRFLSMFMTSRNRWR